MFIDTFHGCNTQIAVNVRAYAKSVAPCYKTIVRTAPDRRIGMDYVHRSNFEAQQCYFAWCRGQAAGAAPAVPDFADLIQSITLNLCTKFNYLPSDWYLAAGLPPSGPREAPPTPAPGPAPSPSRTPRQASGVVAVVNPHANRTLLARFRSSGHSSITQMMEGHTCTVPRLGDQEVCLAWALKGQCSSGCRRAAQHQR